MRNNEDRLGGALEASEAPPTNTTNNPSNGSSGLLNFVAPTDFVELPSKGTYYPKEHALRGQKTIEIRQMTAKDEDILTSRALLQQGIAIDRLLDNLIIDNNIRAKDLLVGDKNAIMITARASAYGRLYETSVQCPYCAQHSEHSFDLEEALVLKEVDSEVGKNLTEDATYRTTLPASKAEVEIKYLTSEDEKKLMNLTERRRKHKLQDTAVTDQVKAFVVSINGVSDLSEIAKFVDNMPAKDSRYIRSVYADTAPNVDLTQDYICKHCLTETVLEVPFSTDFFWPRS
tara:strand:+ start:3741 stop:4604 length:864 start_codon:yes stop_codon:yes gene_type:complete